MTAETQTAFAKRIGRAKSWVTALKATGRLVMTPEGLVDVEQSLARIGNTTGGRQDVADRHAAERSAPGPRTQAPVDDKVGNSYQAARAVKEKYAALAAKASYEQQIGALIPREDVEAAMRFIGGAVRAALDVMPDQTAPLVAPATDLAEVHDTLRQACMDAMSAIGHAIEQQKQKTLSPEAA